MDIVAHSFWAAAVSKTINQKVKKPLILWKAILFSIAPDIFSFTPIIIWISFRLVFSESSFTDFKNSHGSTPVINIGIFNWTDFLYSFSHSLIVFFAAFGLFFVILRRPAWEIFGWLLHILIDIPTHSYKFYPTPIFWPISNWRFGGISWGTPWFMAANYSLMLLIFVFFWWYKKKKKEKIF